MTARQETSPKHLDPPDPPLRRVGGPGLSEWLAAAAFVALAIFVLADTWDLAFNTQFGPGPRFFPVLLSIPLLVLAALHLTALFRAERLRAKLEPSDITEATAWADRPKWLRFGLLVATLFIYAAVLDDLGFELATGLLMFATLALLGRRPLQAVAEALIATAILYFLFKVFLGVQLPPSRIPLLGMLGL